MTGRTYGYVYGGTVTFGDQVRELDGTAWSLGRCDEVRLRSAAVRDLSRTENVPLAGVEITRFWYSEIVSEDGTGGTPTDPFASGDIPQTQTDPFALGDT